MRSPSFSFLLLLGCLVAGRDGHAADEVRVSSATIIHWLDDLESAEPAIRRHAAEWTAGIGPLGLPAIGEVLSEMRKARVDPGVAGLVRAATPTGGPARDDELVLRLLELPPSGVSHRTALATTCLIGALERIGTTEAVREMILVSRDQAGAFRGEVTRQVDKLGEKATAALILAAHDPARDLALWAMGELESLGRRVPGDAVQTKSNQVLADVLEAYGTTHDMDALPAVLSFVNADRTLVREAARRATQAYGDLALPKLRESSANLSGTSPPPTGSAMDVSRELFSTYDRFRLSDVYAVMDRGLADEARGEHESAVRLFEEVLARQPLFERREEMVPAFVLYARALEDRDRRSAEAYYRVARRLSPDGPLASQVASALDFLEGEERMDGGIVARDLFRRASEEDPGNRKAHDKIALLDAERERRRTMLARYAEGCGAAAMLAVGLILWIGRRTRPKRSIKAQLN